MFTYKQIKKEHKSNANLRKRQKTFNTPAHFQAFKHSSVQAFKQKQKLDKN